MCRISFERPCIKNITATYTIFDREHTGVTHVNVCEFRGNQRIYTGVIVRTDRQTDGRTDTPTDKLKSLTLYNFSWKVLKRTQNSHFWNSREILKLNYVVCN
jgi:hypothetical protein